MGDNDNKAKPASDGNENLDEALSELKKDIESIGKLDWRGEKKPEAGK